MGFGIIFFGLLYFVSDKIFLIDAKPATGSIANIHTELVFNPQYRLLFYTPEKFADISFSDATGKFITTKIRMPNMDFKNNDKVAILYNPSNPKNVKIASILSPLKNIGTVALGTIIFLVGFYLYRRSNRIYFSK